MRLRAHVAVFLLFVALVALYTWPFMRDPVELPDNPDAHAMTWIMLTVFHNLFAQPTAIFQGPAFYPMGNSLTYTEPLVVPALVAGPVFLLTGNPVLAHKVALLLLWALSGWATYAVTLWLTRRHAPALVAALVFTLSLPRIEYVGEFQMEITFGMPLAIYALVRFLEDQRPGHLTAFFTVLWLQAISVWYVAVILGLGLAILIPQYVALRWVGWRRRALVGAALGGGAFLLALWPVARPYLTTHGALGFERGPDDVDVTRYADVLSYLQSGGTSGETSLYVGAVALALAGTSLLWLRPRVSRGRAERLLATSVWASLALVVLATLAGRRFRLGHSAFSAAGAALLLLALARQGAEGWRRWRDGLADRRLSERDWVSVLLVVAAFAVLVSLGPVAHVAGRSLGKGFYIWLYPLVFPLHVIRTTSRFGLLAALALALLAALGLTWLVTHAPRWLGRAVTVGVIALLLVDYARFPLTVPMVPVVPRPVDTLLRTEPGDGVVLEWPMFPAIDGDAMVRSLFHGHGVVNGWSGFVPEFTHDLSNWLTQLGPPFPTSEAQAALRQIYPLRYLAVRLDRLPPEWRESWHALRGDPPPFLGFRGTVGEVDLYELRPVPDRGTRFSRLVSYDFLRRRPVLHVALGPVDPDPALDQWVDLEVNGRLVLRVPVNQAATWSAALSPPYRPVTPNEIVLTHRYRYRVPPSERDARYHLIGRTGKGLPHDLEVLSAGQPYGNHASIQLDGLELAPNRRGYNLAALDPGGTLQAVAVFDTLAGSGASRDLAAWVQALAPGTIVAGAVKDEASSALGADAVAALGELGVKGDLRGRYRASHAFVGVKGAGPGTAVEALEARAVAVTVGPPGRPHGVDLRAFELAPQ